MGDKLIHDIYINGERIPEGVTTYSHSWTINPATESDSPYFCSGGVINNKENDSLMFFPDGEEVSITVDIKEEDVNHILWNTQKDLVKDLLTPRSIIHNRKDDSYIIIWKWGEKTIVRPMSGELSSPYAAFTAALAEIIFGSNSQVNKIVGMTIEPGKRGEKVLTLGERVKLAKKEMKRIKQQGEKDDPS